MISWSSRTPLAHPPVWRSARKDDDRVYLELKTNDEHFFGMGWIDLFAKSGFPFIYGMYDTSKENQHQFIIDVHIYNHLQLQMPNTWLNLPHSVLILQLCSSQAKWSQNSSRSVPGGVKKRVDSGLHPGFGNGADVETDEPQMWHSMAQHWNVWRSSETMDRSRLKTLDATFICFLAIQLFLQWMNHACR